MKFQYSIFIFFAVVLVALSGCSRQKPKTVPEQALEQAQELYRQAKTQNVDLSPGPCLSEGLFVGAAPSDQWVVDIAHNPRLELDNYPVNQCRAFIKGDAKHFVELNESGELIKYY